jgi:hypothetical protein
VFKAGDRIRFISTDDPWSRMPSGMEGTVSFIDHLGTIHVTWDDGGTLGMIPGEDQFESIKEAE